MAQPNPKLKQISKKLQTSETDRLLEKARGVEKTLHDLLSDDDNDDPDTEIQMMDIDDPSQALATEKMDVEDPIQAPRAKQPKLGITTLLMLADVALTHADLKPYEL